MASLQNNSAKFLLRDKLPKKPDSQAGRNALRRTDCADRQTPIERLRQQCLSVVKKFALFRADSVMLTHKANNASCPQLDNFGASLTTTATSISEEHNPPRSTRHDVPLPGEGRYIPHTPGLPMDSPTIPGWHPTYQQSSNTSSVRSSDNPFLKAVLNPISKTNAPSSQQRNATLPHDRKSLGRNSPNSSINTSKSSLKPSVTAKAVRFGEETPPPVPQKPPKSILRALPKAAGSLENRMPPSNPPTGVNCCYLMLENGSQQATYRCRRQESSPQAEPVLEARKHLEAGSPSEISVDQSRRSLTTDRGYFTLPFGLTPSEASSTLSAIEMGGLRDHAKTQAEKFKVLTAQQVLALSLELEALDEHRKYLRNTYHSLQSGRRVLHEQTIRYLQSPNWTVAKCREQMLIRERALMDLNLSVDEWAHKLEQATKRRVSIRRKLLEHTTAALVVEPSSAVNRQRPQVGTSNMQSTGCTTRRAIQSIQIFADSTLFADSDSSTSNMI